MIHRAAPFALLLLAACGGVPDSGRGVGGPRSVEARGRAAEPAVVPAMALLVAAPGTMVPVGQVATACGVSGGALGAPIAEAGSFVLHDTAPGSIEARTHFVTGFSDGCPRQVTAALAVFGDPATHETFRYDTISSPYGLVDEAYEAIKGQVCRVASGTPCGGAIDALAADTAFLTLYPEFGGEAHANVLLHAGEVVAADL